MPCYGVYNFPLLTKKDEWSARFTSNEIAENTTLGCTELVYVIDYDWRNLRGIHGLVKNENHFVLCHEKTFNHISNRTQLDIQGNLSIVDIPNSGHALNSGQNV